VTFLTQTFYDLLMTSMTSLRTGYGYKFLFFSEK